MVGDVRRDRVRVAPVRFGPEGPPGRSELTESVGNESLLQALPVRQLSQQPADWVHWRAISAGIWPRSKTKVRWPVC